MVDAIVTAASVSSATSTSNLRPVGFLRGSGSGGDSTFIVASSETTTEPAPVSVNTDSFAAPSSTVNSAALVHSTNTTSVR